MAVLTQIKTEASPFNPEPITDQEAGAMFRAALNLFKVWGVRDDQAAILLGLMVRTYRRWKKDGKVGQIGAIQQKAISAKSAHAQIFIVPACGDDRVCSKDLQRLRQRVGKSIDVEPVATLAQALRVLREAGGAPVRTGSTS